ncbi:hypothetical protein GOV04_02075 [Candidatus Woesearchaeota archaeon]|nr:hypothetical protein [Candidatus Woesearchaeota archaeon]
MSAVIMATYYNAWNIWAKIVWSRPLPSTLFARAQLAFVIISIAAIIIGMFPVFFKMGTSKKANTKQLLGTICTIGFMIVWFIGTFHCIFQVLDWAVLGKKITSPYELFIAEAMFTGVLIAIISVTFRDSFKHLRSTAQ